MSVCMVDASKIHNGLCEAGWCQSRMFFARPGCVVRMLLDSSSCGLSPRLTSPAAKRGAGLCWRGDGASFCELLHGECSGVHQDVQKTPLQELSISAKAVAALLGPLWALKYFCPSS